MDPSVIAGHFGEPVDAPLRHHDPLLHAQFRPLRVLDGFTIDEYLQWGSPDDRASLRAKIFVADLRRDLA